MWAITPAPLRFSRRAKRGEPVPSPHPGCVRLRRRDAALRVVDDILSPYRLLRAPCLAPPRSDSPHGAGLGIGSWRSARDPCPRVGRASRSRRESDPWRLPPRCEPNSVGSRRPEAEREAARREAAPKAIQRRESSRRRDEAWRPRSRPKPERPTELGS